MAAFGVTRRLILGFAAVQMVVEVRGIVETRRDRALEKVSYPCSQEISSETSKNGTFTSPNYPEPYPPLVSCQYKFTGAERERVQIIFTDFDLHLPHEPPRSCDSVDAVMIFVTIDGQRDNLLDNFCGNKLPAQLMSNGPDMEVVFRSLHSSPEVKGFRALYRFVSDYGITSTKQKGTDCEFVFSSEEKSNGSFTSPNYPGYYPRDTECNYIFRGRANERVHITFIDFDVDGVEPCLSATASDYVEFSQKTSDGTMSRYCGDKKPKEIVSDEEFFRVTFKSNEKFDSTGFEAFYQFRKQVDPLTVKRVSTTSANGSSSKPHFLNSIASGATFGMNRVMITLLTALIHVCYSLKL